MGKILMWIVIIIIVALGAWYFLANSAGSTATPAENTMPTATQSTETMPSGSSLPTSDSSDASLKADAAVIDTHMQAASNDSAAVEQSFNDKPVSQSY